VMVVYKSIVGCIVEDTIIWGCIVEGSIVYVTVHIVDSTLVWFCMWRCELGLNIRETQPGPFTTSLFLYTYITYFNYNMLIT
jgi:hypothetical protein